MTEHIQARTTSEAYWTLDPFAVVRPGDPWFADLERIVPRAHYGVARRLERQLSAGPGRPEFVHVGLMGHAGVGKTTLVKNALAKLAREGLAPVYINALESFDQSDYVFSDLMLVLAEAVIRELAELGLALGGEQLELVRRWFADEILIESHRKQIVASIDTGAELGASLPFVGALAAKVTAALKSDNDYRKEIRSRAERDPRDLVRRVNLLLDAVHQALAPRKAKLCVVFDNLEKTRLELVDRALLARSDEFRRLRTNAVLFFNPSCEYSPLSTPASRAFECINVPVLPVRFPGDAPETIRPEAATAIEAILARRLVLDAVFADVPGCIEALARWSGGHIRDMLTIARRAVENVEPEPVAVDDIAKAGIWLGRRRTSSLRPEDFTRAVEIHRTNRILDTDQDRRMLKNSCVLPYNGSEWWDVHPAIRADELFMTALREAED